MAKYKEKRILLFDLRITTAIQICLKYVKVPKSLDPTADPTTTPQNCIPKGFRFFHSLKEESHEICTGVFWYHSIS
jgi:hypothetical protein